MSSGESWDLTSLAVGFAAAPLLYMLGKAALGGGRAAADTKPREQPLKVLIAA